MKKKTTKYSMYANHHRAFKIATAQLTDNCKIQFFTIYHKNTHTHTVIVTCNHFIVVTHQS